MEGLWIAGAAGGGDNMYRCNLTGPLAIVIGNEGDGIAPLVAKNCDFFSFHTHVRTDGILKRILCRKYSFIRSGSPAKQ